MAKTNPNMEIEMGYVMNELATIPGSTFSGFCAHSYTGDVMDPDLDDSGKAIIPTGIDITSQVTS